VFRLLSWLILRSPAIDVSSLYGWWTRTSASSQQPTSRLSGCFERSQAGVVGTIETRPNMSMPVYFKELHVILNRTLRVRNGVFLVMTRWLTVSSELADL
jgi:hypothetical protein